MAAVEHALSPALSFEFATDDSYDDARPHPSPSIPPTSPLLVANPHREQSESTRLRRLSADFTDDDPPAWAALARLRETWTAARRSRAGRRALIVVALSSLVYLFHRVATKARPQSTAETLYTVSVADWRGVYASQHDSIARVSPGVKETFLEYLDAHFPLANAAVDGHMTPHIWITLAETRYVSTGVANLDLFLRQLNSERAARHGTNKPETRLVVLCLDRECLRECGRRQIYAYGGYERVRPPQILRATWPKVGAFIDILPHRDLFFVDADVSFRADPYPYLELLMQRFDILAQENEALEHFNTGWLWMRKGETVAEAWRAVLAADMQVESRDQVFFNEILGTREFRLGTGNESSHATALQTSFTARNGLRVKILDPSLFRVFHLEGLTHLSRHDSLFLHTTCADDIEMKLFVPKVEGFWQDVDAYYTRPRKLLSIEHLAGTREDIAQLFLTLLTLSYYTSRSLIPPTHVTFLDLLSDVHARKSYAAFPLSHLAQENNPLHVSVVEPQFVSHATSALLGRSVLNGSEGRVDDWWKELGEEERDRRQRRALALTRVVEVDMRPHATLSYLLRHLTTEPTILGADHVRLIHHDWTGHQHWRTWVLPETVWDIGLCDRLDELPTCDEICRFREGRRGLVVRKPWPPIEDLL
ncbi:hypothetical protein JCM10908_005523 [Rhodotorula pacifica]|uniref:uncharacterized protein n=1 Tax=Rhodotorula pacifica TaxID=1495444 RepID=UPI00317BFED3